MFSKSHVIFSLLMNKRLRKPSTVNIEQLGYVNKLFTHSFDYLLIVVLQKTSNQQVLKMGKEEISNVQLIKQVNEN